jgi:hypothetical protein
VAERWKRREKRVIAASKALMVAAAAMALVGCDKGQPAADHNIVVDNSPNAAANAEIETLPADESSGTPSNQLENGEDNPDVSDLNASTNLD